MGMELIIQIIAGLVGGNGAGAALKNLSLGTAGNSVVGAVGGGLGGVLMGMLGGDPQQVRMPRQPRPGSTSGRSFRRRLVAVQVVRC
jgi:uncharacterized membrane protein YeaQ/YmgE (transglycosylase-associated protein family)